MADIYGMMMDGLGLIRQGKEESKQKGLAALMGQAVTAPREQRQGIIGQMAATDPKAAFDAQAYFREIDQDSLADIGRYATAFDALPEDQKAVEYPRFAMQMQRMRLPAPLEWSPEYGPRIKQIAAAWGGAAGAPAGMQEFNALTQGLSPDDVAKARRIRLGLDGRASSAGFGFQEFEGADGRKRLGRQNPRTGVMEVYDEITGNFVPMGGAPSQPSGVTLESMPFVFDDAENMPAQVVGAITAQEMAAGGAPQMATGNPALGVGRTKEEEAAAVEDAKQRVSLGYLPQAEAIKARAAVDQATGIERAKAGVELETKQAGKARDAAVTLSLLDEAEKILPSATSGRVQNMGAQAAGAAGISTPGAQATARLNLIAAQLVAKVPRFEGPQSNIDVQFYREAAGDLANPNLPVQTRMAALETMRSLNEKYAAGGQPAGAAPKRLKFNPATGRIE